jgi:snoRNA binding domain, fibrillarin
MTLSQEMLRLDAWRLVLHTRAGCLAMPCRTGYVAVAQRMSIAGDCHCLERVPVLACMRFARYHRQRHQRRHLLPCRYGWHFPELSKIIDSNIAFAKTVRFMGARDKAAALDFSAILEEEVEGQVKEAAVVSMGTEISEEDLAHVSCLCDQVVELSEYRAQLYEYLKNRMQARSALRAQRLPGVGLAHNVVACLAQACRHLRTWRHERVNSMMRVLSMTTCTDLSTIPSV